ncbi:MAG: hypothetical protein ABI346_10010 [Candidatus Baltobacteraceae bacterium]
MPTTTLSPAAELQRAIEILTKNWILAIPTALASLVMAILTVFLFVSLIGTAAVGGALGGHAGAGLAALSGGVLYGGLFAVIAIVVNVLAQAVVMQSSEDAWSGRAVDLMRSLATVTPKLIPLAIALVLCFLVLLIPALLCVFLIGFPLVLIVGFFLMYVVPAVIIGGESPTAALSSSYRIVRANLGPSIIAFLGIVVALIVFGIINSIVAHIPIVNLVVPFLVGGFASAFAALVAARFYDLLREGGSAAATFAPNLPPPNPL